MILPIECSDAVTALRTALSVLGETGAPPFVIVAFTHAEDVTSRAVRQADDWRRMEDTEARHVDSQLFPWVNDD